MTNADIDAFVDHGVRGAAIGAGACPHGGALAGLVR
jgi:hypothetical protein